MGTGGSWSLSPPRTSTLRPNGSGFSIKSCHSNNGIFAAKEFKAGCERLNQTIDFSSVGAQHQNGVAEQNIKTVAQWARANMLHLAYH